MVSHLLNIDEGLAKQVAGGLGLKEVPQPAEAAKLPKNLKNSPALSIQLNGPRSFKGRKVGALVTDGVDINILEALKAALKNEGALLEIVAPKVGGVEASDGTWIQAAQKVDGGPSVPYDAVALLPSEERNSWRKSRPRATSLPMLFAHMKFIGYVEPAAILFGKAGVPESRDEGFILLKGADCSAFIAACRQLRYWARVKG
jgi:catalase